jgi:hypothetical protein
MAAPKNLASAGAALWESIADAYDLRPDELRLLADACREADLIDTMSTALSRVDLMTLGSMGQPVVHPYVSEIRQHRTVLASLLRSLKLPDESSEGAVNQQRQAGNASWSSRRGA